MDPNFSVKSSSFLNNSKIRSYVRFSLSSAVDTDTEDQILDNLKQTRQNKTTIMIAHRISTVKNADHILVLEDGKKAEFGTFDELMAIGGIFKEMYDKQQLEKQLNAE